MDGNGNVLTALKGICRCEKNDSQFIRSRTGLVSWLQYVSLPGKDIIAFYQKYEMLFLKTYVVILT
jgi:hypothetical protein